MGKIFLSNRPPNRTLQSARDGVGEGGWRAAENAGICLSASRSLHLKSEPDNGWPRLRRSSWDRHNCGLVEHVRT